MVYQSFTKDLNRVKGILLIRKDRKNLLDHQAEKISDVVQGSEENCRVNGSFNERIKEIF